VSAIQYRAAGKLAAGISAALIVTYLAIAQADRQRPRDAVVQGATALSGAIDAAGAD